jgi:hypothetical protein
MRNGVAGTMALTMTAGAAVVPPSPPALMPSGLVGDSTCKIAVVNERPTFAFGGQGSIQLSFGPPRSRLLLGIAFAAVPDVAAVPAPVTAHDPAARLADLAPVLAQAGGDAVVVGHRVVAKGVDVGLAGLLLLLHPRRIFLRHCRRGDEGEG